MDKFKSRKLIVGIASTLLVIVNDALGSPIADHDVDFTGIGVGL